jgi:hypothetical protein
MTQPTHNRARSAAARWVGLLALAALLAGCITPAENPNPPIPPAQSETRPLPPVSAQPLSWQPGHWSWNGSAYVWDPGQYVPAEGHGVNWMPGFWQHTDDGWVWRPAHWV